MLNKKFEIDHEIGQRRDVRAINSLLVPLSDIEQEEVFVGPSEVRSAKLSWIIPLFGIAIGFMCPNGFIFFFCWEPRSVCVSLFTSSQFGTRRRDSVVILQPESLSI